MYGAVPAWHRARCSTSKPGPGPRPGSTLLDQVAQPVAAGGADPRGYPERVEQLGGGTHLLRAPDCAPVAALLQPPAEGGIRRAELRGDHVTHPALPPVRARAAQPPGHGR